jgi:glycosyltransferase involved in cell wall biosynthesis
MTDPLRIAVLWKQLSGYWDTSMTTLAERSDVAVWMAYRRALPNAPFDDSAFESARDAYGWDGRPGRRRLRRHLEDFHPDVIMVSSWDIDDYRREARRWSGRAVRVLCMDNQWLATPKQHLGVATSRLYVRPAFDVAYMPGDTQGEFARRLGYPTDLQLRGLYCGDQPRFERAGGSRRDVPRRFLFVGRLIEEKGVDVLADAFCSYREEAGEDAWTLTLAGAGPFGAELRGITGVEVLDFVQPADLPALMGAAGCFVLPSRFEPWGVVMHEATAAGLPVIATAACGASTRLLQDGYNGRLVATGDADALARAMSAVASVSEDELVAMGDASRNLSRQFTPKRWADYTIERLRAHRTRFVGG